MVVCDSIHIDPSTGKRYLLGTFSIIHAVEFPATHPVLCLYVSMTNGRGDTPIRIQLIDADEEREPIFVNEAEVPFDDPRTVVEMGIVLQNITFEAPGEYRFQLFASDEFLMERRILVNDITQVTE
jgi:hypothetical protein